MTDGAEARGVTRRLGEGTGSEQRQLSDNLSSAKAWLHQHYINTGWANGVRPGALRRGKEERNREVRPRR